MYYNLLILISIQVKYVQEKSFRVYGLIKIQLGNKFFREKQW